MATLCQAVKDRNYNKVVLLLNTGYNIDEKKTNNETPLSIAVVENFFDIATLLLLRGAKKDANSQLLLTAIGNGSCSMVELLLAHGANPNQLEMPTNHNSIA